MNFRIFFPTLLSGFLATAVFGQTFSTPLPISADAGAHSPAMHVGRDGTIYISWFERNADIFFSHSTDGGASFSPPVRVSRQVTTNNYTSLLQRAPNFALDTNGTIHLVWMEARIPNPITKEEQSDIWYARSTDHGSTWTPPSSIMDADDSTLYAQDYPAIAIDSANNLYVCYIDNRYLMRGVVDHYKLQLERSTDGGASWTTPVIADKLPFANAGTCECCRDDIAVSPEGHVYIAFRTSMTEPDGDMRDIFIARSMDGGVTFDSSIQCQLGNWNLTACPTKGPQIALDGNENLHIAWADARDDSSGKLTSYYSLLRRTDSTVFPNYSLSTGNLPYSEWPDVAVGPNGTIAYAYTGSGPNMFSYSSNGGNTWHRSLPLPGASSDAQTVPALAFDRAGNLYTAWEDANNNGILFTKISGLNNATLPAPVLPTLTRGPGQKIHLSWSLPINLSSAPFVWYSFSLNGPETEELVTRDSLVMLDSLPPGSYNYRITAMTTTGESEENGTFTVNSASVRLPNAAMEKVYPNPVTGGILMITSNAMSGPQLLRIIDGRGSIVKKISVTPEEATLKVDVRDLPSGAYTCEIMGKTLRHIRFIIP